MKVNINGDSKLLHLQIEIRIILFLRDILALVYVEENVNFAFLVGIHLLLYKKLTHVSLSLHI